MVALMIFSCYEHVRVKAVILRIYLESERDISKMNRFFTFRLEPAIDYKVIV